MTLRVTPARCIAVLSVVASLTGVSRASQAQLDPGTRYTGPAYSQQSQIKSPLSIYVFSASGSQFSGIVILNGKAASYKGSVSGTTFRMDSPGWGIFTGGLMRNPDGSQALMGRYQRFQGGAQIDSGFFAEQQMAAWPSSGGPMFPPGPCRGTWVDSSTGGGGAGDLTFSFQEQSHVQGTLDVGGYSFQFCASLGGTQGMDGSFMLDGVGIGDATDRGLVPAVRTWGSYIPGSMSIPGVVSGGYFLTDQFGNKLGEGTFNFAVGP